MTIPPQDEGRSAPAFGDTPSKVLRPSGGEITVETRGVNQALGGPAQCMFEGRKTAINGDWSFEAAGGQ
jgi:hypothetical protein